MKNREALAIAEAITNRGDRVYVGHVFPLRGRVMDPTFVYERRVMDRDGVVESMHVTRDPSGAIQIVESAAHAPDYALASYTLHTNQLGESGSVEVENDRVSFRLTDGTRERRRTERQSGPVVVGPTLVGFMLHQLAALRHGRTVSVRLAVLDRLETVGFRFETVPAPPGHMRIRMRPTSVFIALLVAPLHFTFDTSTGKLLSLEGRVPPRVRQGKGWNVFDARVDYDFAMAGYR